MPQEKTEQEKFLEQFEEKINDPFAQLEEPEKAPEVVVEEPDKIDTETLRNRKERRMAAKYEAERAASMQLAERLRAEEAKSRDREASEKDYLKSVKRIYGTESPEAKEATELLENALRGLEESATERALEKMREERRQEQEELRKAEQEIDMMLEEIEDEAGVDLTANTATRTGFLKLLEKMSPKDEHGNVVQYADHHAVWEVYQARTTKKVDMNVKDIASRSMTQGSPSSTGVQRSSALDKFMVENDLTF